MYRVADFVYPDYFPFSNLNFICFPYDFLLFGDS